MSGNGDEHHATNGDTRTPLLEKENTLKLERENTLKWTNEEETWNIVQSDSEKYQKLFFNHVTIAEDGGLSEIGYKDELWYDTRFISSTIVLLFVVYNVLFLLYQDVGAIVAKPEPYNHFLLTSSVLSQFGLALKAPQKIMSVVELLILFVLLCRAVWHVCTILCGGEFRRWQATAHLCWFTLPDLSCYSAIKVLQFVTPQQLMYDLNYVLWYEPKATQKLKLVIWFVRTPLAWIIGLDTFLIKVRLANGMIMDGDLSCKDLLGVVILLNQILGVVQLGKTIRNRLYRFVFAGEDGMMTDEERIRQDVWEAMVAQRIFKEFAFPKAVALMLSWCDDDFQMLALNDTDLPAHMAPDGQPGEGSHSRFASCVSEPVSMPGDLEEASSEAHSGEDGEECRSPSHVPTVGKQEAAMYRIDSDLT